MYQVSYIEDLTLKGHDYRIINGGINRSWALRLEVGKSGYIPETTNEITHFVNAPIRAKITTDGQKQSSSKTEPMIDNQGTSVVCIPITQQGMA
jgi:hypothetical protein